MYGLHRELLVDRAADGWWYALGNGTCTHAVYCTDASLLGRGREGVATVWQNASRAAGDWLPRNAADLRPTAWAATVSSSHPPREGQIRLVGDAAMSTDPLSGQGLTFALESGSGCGDTDYDDFVDKRNTSLRRGNGKPIALHT
jgi:flavin-dependent dehydrogenase